MTERKWIAEHASIEMGKTVKYRVIDIDKVVEKLKKEREDANLTPYIDIIPVSADMHKMPNKYPTYQKDPITGVYYGIANGEDVHGNITWQRLQLNDNLSLNLDNVMDAKIWAIIRFNPDIEGSPFQKQNPYYKVFDPVDQAKSEMREVEAMKEAFRLVDELEKSPKEMVFFARYLGEDIRENSNKSIVMGALSRAARHRPVDFINKFRSKDRSYAERFHSAVALGIVENHPDRGYMYKNLPLGYSEEEAIKILAADNALMSAINSMIIEKDTVMRIVQAEVSHQALKTEKPPKKESKTDPITKESQDKEEEPLIPEEVTSKKTVDNDFE